MNDVERNRFETFKRVRNFGLTYATHFPAGSLGKQLFTDLQSVITELTGQATVQNSATRAARQRTHAKSVARAALWAALKEITLTARVMAITQPNLVTKFRIRERLNEQVMLSTARAFLGDAQPLQNQFISHDRPETFLVELDEKIARFEEALNDQQRAVSQQVMARAAIQRAIKRGVELVQVLDRVMANKYIRDETVLTAWRSARHVAHPQRHPLPDAPASSPPQPGRMSR